MFIIPTYHNKQWQLRLGPVGREKLSEWRETKISGEQRGEVRGGVEGLGGGVIRRVEGERESVCACGETAED